MQLSEAEFWRKYFQSKLFNTLHASILSSAAQHVVKDDRVWDHSAHALRRLAELQARRIQEERVDTFADLGATFGDREEVIESQRCSSVLR